MDLHELCGLRWYGLVEQRPKRMMAYSARGQVANVCVGARGSGDGNESGLTREVSCQLQGGFGRRAESLLFK